LKNEENSENDRLLEEQTYDILFAGDCSHLQAIVFLAIFQQKNAFKYLKLTVFKLSSTKTSNDQWLPLIIVFRI
jgi:hypothetical protein